MSDKDSLAFRGRKISKMVLRDLNAVVSANDEHRLIPSKDYDFEWEPFAPGDLDMEDKTIKELLVYEAAHGFFAGYHEAVAGTWLTFVKGELHFQSMTDQMTVSTPAKVDPFALIPMDESLTADEEAALQVVSAEVTFTLANGKTLTLPLPMWKP